MDNDLAIAQLLASGVFPSARKLTAPDFQNRGAVELQQFGADIFFPSTIDVAAVTGGFNTVVEVSAEYCRRKVSTYIAQCEVGVAKSVRRLINDLAGIKIDGVQPTAGTLGLDLKAEYAVGVRARLQTIHLLPRNQVELVYEGTIGLYSSVSKDHEQRLNRTAVFSAQEVFDDSMGTSAKYLGLEHEWGTLEVRFTCPYSIELHAAQLAVDVPIDVLSGVLALNAQAGPATDVLQLYRESIESRIRECLCSQAIVPLIPTVSLVGGNGGSVPVAEIQQCDVRSGAVESVWGQALFIAFDVVPGCKGITRSVQHFIGPNDYGVIHDDYVVHRVLFHKWNRGGFDRQLRLSEITQIEVERDGDREIEDARVEGRLFLDTLDTAVLEVDADTRYDSLKLGGVAHAVAERLTLLADGTTVDRDSADLGPSEYRLWEIRVDPLIEAPREMDPELAEFLARAHSDGIRHLGRPFLLTSAFEPTYVRIEAVSKRFYLLGRGK